MIINVEAILCFKIRKNAIPARDGELCDNVAIRRQSREHCSGVRTRVDRRRWTVEDIGPKRVYQMATTPKRFKITVVGDGMVGKTCMLYVFIENKFPKEYVPTVFDNYIKQLTVDEQTVEMTLWDTAGQEDYERLRPLSYPQTDCFLLCYSISNRASYDNVLLKWYPELKHYAASVPVVLVATKTDLRGKEENTVTTQEGKKLKRKIKALNLVECSALNNDNVKEVFEESIRAALSKKSMKMRSCFFL